MAEEVGFEPTDPLRGQTISSATFSVEDGAYRICNIRHASNQVGSARFTYLLTGQTDFRCKMCYKEPKYRCNLC